MKYANKYGAIIALTCMSLVACGGGGGGGTSGYAIGGSITGLTSAGLVLQNNGSDNLSVSSGATSFTFPTPVSSYAVSVLTQPAGLTCSVNNASGSATANVSNVAVNCAPTGVSSVATGALLASADLRSAASDKDGNVYVADKANHAIYKIAPGAQPVLYAGTAGTAGTNESATKSAIGLNAPEGVAVDNAGNVYVADTGNCTIRKLPAEANAATLSSQSVVIAGHTCGYNPGSGIAVQFNHPTGLALLPDGTLLIADTGNHIIRKLNPNSGVVTEWVGTIFNPGHQNGTGIGVLASPLIPKFNTPTNLAVDTINNRVFVADSLNNLIRVIDAGGNVSDYAGDALLGPALSVNDSVAGLSAKFNQPTGLAIDAANNLYVSEKNGNLIRKIAPNGTAAGTVTTVAGTPGVGGTPGVAGTTDSIAPAGATFTAPWGLTIASGKLYVTELASQFVRRLNPLP